VTSTARAKASRIALSHLPSSPSSTSHSDTHASKPSCHACSLFQVGLPRRASSSSYIILNNDRHIDNLDTSQEEGRACKMSATLTDTSVRKFDHLPRCRRVLPRKSRFQGDRHQAACQRFVTVSTERSRASDFEQDQIAAALGLYVHKSDESDREQARVQDEGAPDRENHDGQEEKLERRDQLLQHRKGQVSFCSVPEPMASESSMMSLYYKLIIKPSDNSLVWNATEDAHSTTSNKLWARG
jgi:hypothetical protein